MGTSRARAYSGTVTQIGNDLDTSNTDIPYAPQARVSARICAWCRRLGTQFNAMLDELDTEMAYAVAGAAGVRAINAPPVPAVPGSAPTDSDRPEDT